MRSRSYCAVSSVVLVLVSACLAGDPKADAKAGEVRPADYKQEDRKEESRDYGEHGGYGGYGGYGSGDEAGIGAPPDMETGEAVPDPIPCPKGEGRMEEGFCAPEEEFFGEQEILDAEALVQLQAADDPKIQAEAQEKLIEQQIRQTYQAEKDLDEIIKDLKQKKAKGELGSPFGEDGKEGL